MSEEIAAEVVETPAEAPEEQGSPAEGEIVQQENNETAEETQQENPPENEEKPVDEAKIETNEPAAEEKHNEEENKVENNQEAPKEEENESTEPTKEEEKESAEPPKEEEKESAEPPKEEEKESTEPPKEEEKKAAEPPKEEEKKAAEPPKEEVKKLPEEPETTESGMSVAERSLWVPNAMEKMSSVVEMREKTRNWYNSYSFGRLKHANFSTCTSQLDRFRVLQLIYQYLHSIGLYHVADSLAAESRLVFQNKDQDMERADIRLILSMSLGPRDNLWDETAFENIEMTNEMFDEDNYSIRFEEKLTGGCDPEDYRKEMTFIDEKRTLLSVSRTSIHALVCAMIMNDPKFMGENGKCLIFSTLGSICKSSHFFAHVQSIVAKHEELQEKVVDLLDDWISFSGLFIGQKTLGAISFFLAVSENEKAKDVIAKIGSLDYGHPVKVTEPKPDPIITLEKGESAEAEAVTKILDPNLTIADTVPEETARQISLMTHRCFARINPYEFYYAISNREYGSSTPGLVELYEFGHKLKKLIISTIVNQGDKKIAADSMDIIIQIAEKLLELNNFEAVSWIVDAFESKAIKNLSGIFASLNPERLQTINALKEKFGASRKSQEYEDMVSECIEKKSPCIPNVRYELDIVAASAYGGDDFPNTMINLKKRYTIGAISCKLIDLQNVPYNFVEVSQIQNVMKEYHEESKENITKYSIMIESVIKVKQDNADDKESVKPAESPNEEAVDDDEEEEEEESVSDEN